MIKIPQLRLKYSEKEIRFIQEGIKEILNSGYLTMGPKVREFEQKFSKYIDVKYSVGVNSGTSSLEIPLRILGVKNKTVIIPSITFMATPLAAINAGAKVIFVDVMPENLSIDPDDLRRKISNNTVGVILVHVGGIISPFLEDIKIICKENELFLLEDAAHAHGSSMRGKKAGSLGICGSFSFYPTKVLNTAEGGMITTNDNSIYEKSLILREHGKEDHTKNIHTELGYNWRFSELHALLGLQQMKNVNDIIMKRQKIAKIYDRELNGLNGITLINIPDFIECSYYKYIIYLDKKYNRCEIKNRFNKEYGILLPGEVYSDPCHKQPVFDKYKNLSLNYKNKFPGSDYIASNQICLPLYPGLEKKEVFYIINALKNIIKNY
ncbi:MAG: hypothetical protein CMG74_07640 [Candidatus Marinimicrobia bacterium]|nr:hypothetical protein [Candidatus Neomarinimicrobiota bacterium]|tara:strand:+ start:36 stop:1175 length:1140 start_codon:yes stop_codon:yes gene_type:complete